MALEQNGVEVVPPKWSFPTIFVGALVYGHTRVPHLKKAPHTFNTLWPRLAGFEVTNGIVSVGAAANI